MKVLFVSDSTTVSGAEIVLLGCADGLQARGHSCHGFVRHSNSRLLDAFRDRGTPSTASIDYSDRIIRTTAHPIDLATFARSFYQVGRQMAHVVKAQGIDVIHSISYPASLYAAFAAAWTGKPHIWHEHNIKRIHPVNRLIYQTVARTCDWVIGPSDAVTSNLAAAGIDPVKLRTVYNGIDLRRFQNNDSVQIEALRRELGLLDGESAVGLFGQMLPYKGHRTLIEAAPEILRAWPRTRFYFVGALENPPYQQELEAALRSSGLVDRFHFTGWRADVQNIIRAMDVVVVATTTPEPAALMLMEAMAMERPIVATGTGGTPEIIADGKTGLLFRPGQAGHLSAQILRVLSDPFFARRLGATGRKRVETAFDHERHLDVMCDLYERAISGRREDAGTGRQINAAAGSIRSTRLQ
jgi:glycosyltransferase involved in cell wall biosynthesis